MKRRFPLILAVLLLVTSISGCSTQSSGETRSSITVGMVVTQDFGQELMLNEIIQVSAGASAMEALHQVADVDAAYGGGFVDGINGVRSGGSDDWFFYVNGIAAKNGTITEVCYFKYFSDEASHVLGRQKADIAAFGFCEPALGNIVIKLLTMLDCSQNHISFMLGCQSCFFQD